MKSRFHQRIHGCYGLIQLMKGDGRDVVPVHSDCDFHRTAAKQSWKQCRSRRYIGTGEICKRCCSEWSCENIKIRSRRQYDAQYNKDWRYRSVLSYGRPIFWFLNSWMAASCRSEGFFDYTLCETFSIHGFDCIMNSYQKSSFFFCYFALLYNVDI